MPVVALGLVALLVVLFPPPAADPAVGLVVVPFAGVGGAQEASAAPRRVKGEGIVLVAHVEAELAARQALEAAERTRRWATETYVRKRFQLEVPVEVHLHPPGTEVVILEGVAPEQAQALRVDVAVEPGCPADELVARGLPTATLRELTQQVADAVRVATALAPNDHPAWLETGSTHWIAEQVLQELGRSTGDAETPWISNVQGSLARMLADGSLPRVDQVVNDDLLMVPEPLVVPVLYVTYDLMNRPRFRPKLERLVETVLEMPPDESAEEFRERQEKVFAMKQVKELQEELQEAIEAFAPAWELDLPSLEPATDGGWIQRSVGREGALAWRTEMVGKRAFSIAGRLQLDEASGASAAELLLDLADDGSFLAVSFSSRDGVGLYEMKRHLPIHRPVAKPEAGVVPTGEAVSFVVSLREDDLLVLLDGEEVLEVTLDHKVEKESPWGLRALPGTVVTWSDIELGRSRN